jgi:hypothetical protein
MDIQETLKVVENVQENIAAGVVVIFYYMVVYWPKIKDGLGLSLGRKFDFARTEKNYQLLKLRLEIEVLKKKSGLDSELLEKLEREMQSRQEEKRGKAFTPAQKFIAIPLLIFTGLLILMGLQEASQGTDSSATDVLVGGLFVALVTVIGFWGIPLLQQVQNKAIRKVGFIAFWVLGFYIMTYILFFIVVTNLFDVDELSDAVISSLFLFSLVSSVVLGLIGKLPFMRQDDIVEVDVS